MEDAQGRRELTRPEGAESAVPVSVTVALAVDELPTSVGNMLAPVSERPPVAEQRTSHANASKLASEKVVVAAPLSFAGSAARIWKLTGMTEQPVGRVALGVAAVSLILIAWVVVLAWYLTWGLFLVPYRLIRRGSRKRKREALQHREQLAAIESIRQSRD